MPGYDSAQEQQDDDDLGRWRFAAEIAEVIRSTPADWSARIGIFGKWGEGKSTVLHFLEEMLGAEGNILFYFTPWAAQELDELWQEFGDAFFETLKAERLDVESAPKGATRKLQEKLEATPVPQLAQGIAEFFGKDKAYQSALRLLGRWLKADGEQITKIREKLGDKRVIVLVDDLDRATPELLPKLLLSLREILDLPGFTFVLAFDNEIVSKALISANKAWGDGDSFLDKILDFQYYLPPITKAAKDTFLRKMLSKYAKFVPLDSLGAIEHLIPDNPRKLKGLVRGLLSLQPQLKRHDADELNWVEIWLAEMIRQESYPFFVRLLDDRVLDSLAGISYRFRKNERTRAGKDGDDADTEKLIQDTGGINEQQAARLLELVKATRALGGFQLQYNFRFALRPEALTWKEFREFLAKWRTSPSSDAISEWITKHAMSNSIGQSDVQAELFDTLIKAKQNALSAAADAATVEENAKNCAEARSLLDLIEQFLLLPDMLTPERFNKLYGQFLHWLTFRVNPADRDLRDAEQAVLYRLVEAAPEEQSPGLLEKLKPSDPYAFMPEEGETKQKKIKLRDEYVDRLLPKVTRALVAYLQRPESLRVLSSPDGPSSFRYLLFSPDRLPWGSVIRTTLLDIFQKAKEDSNCYDKTREILELLVGAARNPGSEISKESAEKIVADREIVAAIWQGATSRHIQFRMLRPYLAKRANLLQLGAQEEDLPLSKELNKAQEAMAAEARIGSARP